MNFHANLMFEFHFPTRRFFSALFSVFRHSATLSFHAVIVGEQKNYFLPCENMDAFILFFSSASERTIRFSIAEDSLECSSKDLVQTDLLR